MKRITLNDFFLLNILIEQMTLHTHRKNFYSNSSNYFRSKSKSVKTPLKRI